MLQEIDSAYHSSALLVKLQLLQAQEAGVAIAIDTAVLESEMLLQQIKACESVALSRPASDFVVKRGEGILQPASTTLRQSAQVFKAQANA